MSLCPYCALPIGGNQRPASSLTPRLAVAWHAKVVSIVSRELLSLHYPKVGDSVAKLSATLRSTQANHAMGLGIADKLSLGELGHSIPSIDADWTRHSHGLSPYGIGDFATLVAALGDLPGNINEWLLAFRDSREELSQLNFHWRLAHGLCVGSSLADPRFAPRAVWETGNSNQEQRRHMLWRLLWLRQHSEETVFGRQIDPFDMASDPAQIERCWDDCDNEWTRRQRVELLSPLAPERGGTPLGPQTPTVAELNARIRSFQLRLEQETGKHKQENDVLLQELKKRTDQLAKRTEQLKRCANQLGALRNENKSVSLVLSRFRGQSLMAVAALALGTALLFMGLAGKEPPTPARTKNQESRLDIFQCPVCPEFTPDRDNLFHAWKHLAFAYWTIIEYLVRTRRGDQMMPTGDKTQDQNTRVATGKDPSKTPQKTDTFWCGLEENLGIFSNPPNNWSPPKNGTPTNWGEWKCADVNASNGDCLKTPPTTSNNPRAGGPCPGSKLCCPPKSEGSDSDRTSVDSSDT